MFLILRLLASTQGYGREFRTGPSGVPAGRIGASMISLIESETVQSTLQAEYQSNLQVPVAGFHRQEDLHGH